MSVFTGELFHAAGRVNVSLKLVRSVERKLLTDRSQRRATPSLRVRIPKPDGRERLLGIASLEDKIVQQAVLWVLQSIHEQDFPGFSYAPEREHSRPGRSQHDALDALSVAITSKRVNWILDADVEGLSTPPEGVSCRRTCYGQPSGSSHPPLPAALTRSIMTGCSSFWNVASETIAFFA